jgi:hypothetical protein
VFVLGGQAAQTAVGTTADPVKAKHAYNRKTPKTGHPSNPVFAAQNGATL